MQTTFIKETNSLSLDQTSRSIMFAKYATKINQQRMKQTTFVINDELSRQFTVDLDIFAQILFSRIALKDILVM